MEIKDFKYIARNINSGKTVKGTVEAPSKSGVEKYLVERGLKAVEIKEINSIIGKLNRITIGKNITDQDLIFYLKQFSSLLNAGISVNDASEILANQQEKAAIRRILYGIYYEVIAGSSLSDAMKMFPLEFPKMLISMVEIGEATGELPQIFVDLADYYEKQIKLKSQIKSTLAMPVVYLSMAFGVGAFLILYVIPIYEDLYSDFNNELPAITKFFIDVGDFLTAYWLYLLIGLIVIVTGFIMLKKYSQKFVYKLSEFAIKIPILGEITMLNNLSRTASSLAQLTKCHIPLQDALGITAETITNQVYYELVQDAETKVSHGEKVSAVFQNHYGVEPVFYKMIAIGERSGDLTQMLLSLAKYYEEDSEVKVQKVTKALQPILMIFIYLVVVVMMLAVMMPSLSLSM